MPPRDRIASELRLLEIRPEECIEAYRSVRVGDCDHLDLPLSFLSHSEEGKPPRYRQTQHAALHTAVSFWRDEETALEVARTFDLRHGEYLARVALTFGFGFDYLDPSLEQNPLHLTVWGSSERLARACVSILPIEA